MAFVIPAEIGHAPYAAPVLEFMVRNFERVQIVAVRQKLFADLSEDCWLLYAAGCGGRTEEIRFTPLERFVFNASPPRSGISVSIPHWRSWNSRLRPFLLSEAARDCYASAAADRRTRRLSDVARVGIGYVTGANDFFHLRPSVAARLGIPQPLLHPTVRNGKSLSEGCIDELRVRSWLNADEPVLLLRLSEDVKLPPPVQRYLDSEDGQKARATYKCRNRSPWYVVPDVKVPDGFLSYMSGDGPSLVSNPAGCACTNSVHAVQVTNGMSMARLKQLWSEPLTALSCEIEGHPLGGGMLKVEPREAARVVVDAPAVGGADAAVISEAIATLKRWRHYGE